MVRSPQELINYIQDCLDLNMDEKAIKEKLREAGWSGGDIEKCFIFLEERIQPGIERTEFRNSESEEREPNIILMVILILVIVIGLVFVYYIYVL